MDLPVLKRKVEGIKPYFEVERPQCPFYGFRGMFGVLMDSKGNQCALITESYSPCQMEMREQQPDWSECPFNTEENRDKLIGTLDDIRIFPREFHPPGAKSWKGVSLMSWIKYVWDRQPLIE